MRRHAVTVIVVVVCALLLGPALAPGYTLIGDQVFVPDQSLLPWMLGLGSGLPRSVPQDAVVALLTGPVPGWVWEQVALVGALVLLGAGTARLLRGQGVATQAVAAMVAMWSPYVGERLLLGHWSLLLAVGVLPWALRAADDVRSGLRGAVPRWLLWTALGSLTVTGGLLVLLVTAPVVLWGRATALASRLATVLGGLVLQLPWLVPSVLHPGGAGAGGAEVFALRPEGVWGALVTALGTGGAWNADAVPASRATLLAPLLTGLLLVLAWIGRRDVVTALGRPVATVLAASAAVGLTIAVVGAWTVTDGLTAWVVGTVPGGGLIRDGQKWLAPWLILLAVASALGARRTARSWSRRTADASVGVVLMIGLVVVPVAALPDLVWGSGGRLASVDYPPDWARVRAVLESDPAPGDVVSLPWTAFRRFAWNEGRTVLDPAPRAMPRTVVVSDSLVVRRGEELVVVPGDDPRAAAIEAAVQAGTGLDRVLREQGIGWALVARVGAPATVPTGAVLVVAGADLELYRLRPPDPVAEPAGRVWVLLADALTAGLVLAAAGAAAVGRRRKPAAGHPEQR